jgi:hypothetical protein
LSEDIISELRESYQKYGPIRKVVKTQFGIASGNTRLKAVPEWPVIEKQVKSYYEHLQIATADNISEAKSPEWWAHVLSEAAKELAKEGIEPGRIVARLKEDFPISERSIYRYLPSEFKDQRQATVAATVAASTDSSVSKDSNISNKPEPYGKGLSETASAHRIATNTPTESRLQSLLSYIPGLYPDYSHYEPIDGKYRCQQCGRETGQEGMCERCKLPLQQKTYHPDAVLDGWLVLEVEGEGSASKDNEGRDAYLASKGLALVHIPNDCVAKYPEVISQFVALLHKRGRPDD